MAVSKSSSANYLDGIGNIKMSEPSAVEESAVGYRVQPLVVRIDINALLTIRNGSSISFQGEIPMPRSLTWRPSIR